MLTLMLVALNFLAFAAELAAGGSRVCAEYGLVPAHPTGVIVDLTLHA
jgi:hypothetical protein